MLQAVSQPHAWMYETFLAMDIVLDDFAGARGGVRPEFATGVYGGVDAGVNMVADNGTELATACVDEDSIHHGPMVLSIVTQIGCGCAGTQVDFFTQHRIAYVREMADVGVGKDEAILDFDGLADVTVVTDAGVATDITVRANLAIGSNDDITLNEDTGQDTSARADVDDAFNDCQGMDFTLNGIIFKRGNIKLVRTEEIPWIADDEVFRQPILGQATVVAQVLRKRNIADGKLLDLPGKGKRIAVSRFDGHG